MPRYFDPEAYNSDMEAVADGLFAIAAAIIRLGNADAETPMGALEALGKVFEDGLASLTRSVDEVGSELATLSLSISPPIEVGVYQTKPPLKLRDIEVSL
jgi:hypothetical protein